MSGKTQTCASCTATVRGARLCRTCSETLSNALGRVPDLLEDLDIAYARLDVLADSMGRGGGERAVPYKATARTTAAALSAVVNYWAGQVQRRNEMLPYTTGRAALWLAEQLPRLRRHEHVGAAYIEIRAAVERATVEVDLPAIRTRVTVGPCPCSEHERPCAGTVWAYMPPALTEPAMMRCKLCGAHWGTASWLKISKKILRRMADSAAASVGA